MPSYKLIVAYSEYTLYRWNVICTRCPAGAVIVFVHTPLVTPYVPLVLPWSIIVPLFHVSAPVTCVLHTFTVVLTYDHTSVHPVDDVIDDDVLQLSVT